MTQRVIVGLTPGSDLGLISKALQGAGAESVKGPSPELPDVLIVTLPGDQDVEKFIQRAQGVPGVRYAERDSYQVSF